jgi:hypothetical protein
MKLKQIAQEIKKTIFKEVIFSNKEGKDYNFYTKKNFKI